VFWLLPQNSGGGQNTRCVGELLYCRDCSFLLWRNPPEDQQYRKHVSLSWLLSVYVGIGVGVSVGIGVGVSVGIGVGVSVGIGVGVSVGIGVGVSVGIGVGVSVGIGVGVSVGIGVGVSVGIGVGVSVGIGVAVFVRIGVDVGQGEEGNVTGSAEATTTLTNTLWFPPLEGVVIVVWYAPEGSPAVFTVALIL
jgi:hypothetical protein